MHYTIVIIKHDKRTQMCQKLSWDLESDTEIWKQTLLLNFEKNYKNIIYHSLIEFL